MRGKDGDGGAGETEDIQDIYGDVWKYDDDIYIYIYIFFDHMITVWFFVDGFVLFGGMGFGKFCLKFGWKRLNGRGVSIGGPCY